MSAKEWFEIAASGTTIAVLYGEGATGTERDNTLEKLEGWKSVKIDVETIPNLLGAGDYVVSRHVAAKEIEVEGTITNANDFWDALDALELLAQTKSVISLTLYSRGGARSEQLFGYITDIAEPKRESTTEGIINITFMVPKPIKIVS